MEFNAVILEIMHTPVQLEKFHMHFMMAFVSQLGSTTWPDEDIIWFNGMKWINYLALYYFFFFFSFFENVPSIILGQIYMLKIRLSFQWHAKKLDWFSYLCFLPIKLEGPIRNLSPIKSSFFPQVLMLLKLHIDQSIYIALHNKQFSS